MVPNRKIFFMLFFVKWSTLHFFGFRGATDARACSVPCGGEDTRGLCGSQSAVPNGLPLVEQCEIAGRRALIADNIAEKALVALAFDFDAD